MKKWLFSTLALTAALSANADEIQQPYEKLKKQINVMSNIISSSLAQERNIRRHGIEVDGYYLKNQGVVFEISSNRGLSRIINMFGHDNEFSFTVDNGLGTVATASVPPIPPIAPVVIADGEDVIAVEVDSAMEAYEDAMEAWRDRVDDTRHLREEARELSYELRSKARKKRDLEFEMRHAEKDRIEDLKEELAELKAEMVKIEKKNEALSVRLKKEESVLQEKRSKQAEQVKKASEAYFAKLDNAIVETLCSYGAGLRKLPKTEHVTFVIDMGKQKGNRPGKKIHAFTKKNIVDCVMEEKSPEQLLKSAESYYF